MAARILAKRKVIAYLPNLNAAVKHFSTFNYIDKIASHPLALFPVPASTEPAIPPPSNDKLTLSKDLASLTPNSLKKGIVKSQPSELDYEVLNQFYKKKLQLDGSVSAELELKPSTMYNLECLAVECSEGMKKDFKALFVDHDIQSDTTFSVITLSQKTANDMSSWSPEVEAEREALLEHFIEGANDICKALKMAGYWADFVEPESGRPFYSAYTTDTFFETDYRYKKLGFEINDLGCCKVIVHSIWGPRVYVGSLFTNAPIDHPVITKLTQYMKNDKKLE